MRLLILTVGAVVAGLLTAACGQEAAPHSLAPPPPGSVVEPVAELNGGVGSVCDKYGNLIYIYHASGSIAVIDRPPACASHAAYTLRHP